MSIAVTPATVMVIRYIPWYNPLPHLLQVSHQARLIFNGSNSGCGTGDKHGNRPAIDTGLGNLSRYLRGYVNYIAVPFGLETDIASYYHIAPLLSYS
jgi:hypothetical protein